jgi:opacity protein-like surface antigen
MKWSVPTSVAALIAGIFPAFAADMPVKAPPRVNPAWTGFYLGPNFGLGRGNNKFFDLIPTPDLALDADSTAHGWLGGFQLGYNYQINWLLLGIEGNFDWSGVKSGFSCFSFGNQVCSASDEWYATLVGRIGRVYGRTLFYVDGGPAWKRETVTDVALTAAVGGGIPSVPGDLFSGSQIRAGWTVGAGIEYLLSLNWSAKLEFDYMNFGESPILLNDGAANAFPEEVKHQVELVKLGFNYRFVGVGPGSPIMSYAPEVRNSSADDDTISTIRAFWVYDVSKFSADTTVGGLFALSKDVDTSGLRIYMAGGAGWYQFGTTSSGKVRGVYSTGDLLAGYGFEGNNYSINLLAGGSAENDMLSQFDPTDPVHGTAGGLKVRGDAYVNPTPQTLFYGEGEYSTAFQTYYTSMKYGYDITNGKQIFFGPEVAAFGNQRYDQWRVGAHVSEMKLGKVSVDLSAGFAHDSVVGNGAYTHLEFSTDF